MNSIGLSSKKFKTVEFTCEFLLNLYRITAYKLAWIIHKIRYEKLIKFKIINSVNKIG